MFRREYLSSVVNALISSLKMSDQTKGDIFQLNLPRIHKKSRLIEVLFSFQQCSEPVNTLITEWCSESRRLRRHTHHTHLFFKVF